MPIFKKLFTAVNDMREHFVLIEEEKVEEVIQPKVVFLEESVAKNMSEAVYKMIIADSPDIEKFYPETDLKLLQELLYDCLQYAAKNIEELRKTIETIFQKFGNVIEVYDLFLTCVAKYCSLNNIHATVYTAV